MTYLIKTLTLVSLFSAFSVVANAQVPRKVQFSIGPDAGLLFGQIKQSHTGMLGGSVQLGVPLNKTLYFTAAGGYNYFFGKQNVDLQLQDVPLIDYLGIKSVPIKIGLKYYLNPLVYLQGECGGAFFSGGYNNSSEATISFIYAPQLGIDLPLGGTKFFNIAVRYESTIARQNDAVKIRFLALHAGYGL